MANLRELRDRIRSVNSTKKITKAQELIATSRITKAQSRMNASVPYAEEIQKVVERLASASSLDHPMLSDDGGKVAAVLVISSDRGMCGGYNHNVFKKTAELTKMLEDAGYEVVLYVTGSKGIGYYQFRGTELAGAWSGFSQDPNWDITHDVRRHMIDGFLAGSAGTAKTREGLTDPEHDGVRGFDQVHVVYTEFKSMLSQTATALQLLPVETEVREEEMELGDDIVSDSQSSFVADYEFEPDADTLLGALLPKYVSRTLFSMYLESAASESASRRTAMKAASDNATDLVKTLSREANQARQAQITQEITEIVGGAGALADSGESD